MTAQLFPSGVYTIWWIGVVLTYALFIPVALYFLHRTWSAANGIRRYAAEALEAARGIAANTQHIPALDTTIAVAGEMLATASDVAGKLGTTADVLQERAR